MFPPREGLHGVPGTEGMNCSEPGGQRGSSMGPLKGRQKDTRESLLKPASAGSRPTSGPRFSSDSAPQARPQSGPPVPSQGARVLARRWGLSVHGRGGKGSCVFMALVISSF